jgi:hypothetical protein
VAGDARARRAHSPRCARGQRQHEVVVELQIRALAHDLVAVNVHVELLQQESSRVS